MLLTYVGETVEAKPGPVTATEHGVIAAAVYTNVVPVHVMAAAEGALVMVNVTGVAAADAVWLVSPG